MNKLLALLSAVLFCMVIFSGCTQPAQTNPGQTQVPASVATTVGTAVPASPVSSSFPTGITWRLFSYSNGKGGTTYVVGDQPVTALFRADGQVTGSSGCNQYTATYTATGSTVKVTPGMTTLMACAPTVMDQENSYLDLLSKASTYAVSGDTMLMYDSMGTLVLAFRNPASGPTVTVSSQPPIVGSWDLVTYNNGNNGMGTVLQDSTISVVFTPGGQINGFSGCNQYSGTYTLNNQNIGISQVTGSKSGCDPNLSLQETQYQALLTRANSYEVSNNQLTILNALGDKILIFNRGNATATPVPTVTSVTTPKTIAGSWVLKSFSDGMGGTIPVLDSAPITAKFANTGNLSGSAGCNQYVTSYTVTGLSITVSPVSTTKMSCTPDVMAQETAYVGLLEKAGKFNLYGDSMSLSDSSGTTLLNFKAAP